MQEDSRFYTSLLHDKVYFRADFCSFWPYLCLILLVFLHSVYKVVLFTLVNKMFLAKISSTRYRIM